MATSGGHHLNQLSITFGVYLMQMKYTAITYDMFNLKLIRTLALVSSLQEMQGIQEQVK